jgi:hypothetical protein
LQSGENAISVYPNPSRNIFYLKTGLSKSNEIKLSLTDLEGRELMNKNYFVNKNGIYSLDLSEFSAGIYFLKLRNAESPPVKLVKF